MREIRAVVFDLFDTLVDLYMERIPMLEVGGRRVPASAPRIHEAIARHSSVDFETFARALADVDREFRESRYAQNRELPTEERFGALCQSLQISDDALPAELTSIHMGLLVELSETPSHHAEVLSGLRKRVRLGLCSNFSHSATAVSIMDSGGLREHFDSVVISDAIGWRKPDARIFQRVLAELDLEPDEVCHVGDNLHADVGGAGALGIRTAWITRRVANPERALRDYDGRPPDLQVVDLADLAELLERME